MKHKVLLFFFLSVFILFHSSASGKTGSADTLKILTYNVRNCKGLDNFTNYERIAQIIKRMNADVVAIQELDSATTRSNSVDVLAELALKTGMFSTYNPSISFQGGAYGIGILSKEKPIRKESVPLPGKEEKRSVLLVEMQDFVFCCTHLSLTQDDRKASVGIIKNLVSSCKKPVLLSGDMNAEFGSPEIQLFSENWQLLNDHLISTFPANKPEKCIDFVLAKKSEKFQFRIVERIVENEPIASDHLPVWVKVVVISN